MAPPFALFISYIALRYYKGVPHVNPMHMGYHRTCSQTFMASTNKEKGGQGDGGEDKYLPEKSSLPLDGAVTLASLLHGLIRPVLDCVPWIRSLSKTFGMQFLLLIFFGEHILRGFIDGSGSSGHGFLAIENLAYVQLKVGASVKSVLAAVAGSAWSLKPIFGMLSDVLVVAGYRRAPWVILTAVLGTLGFTGVFAFGQRLGPALLCLCFFFVHMQTAWTDLMVQATYTEQMQKHPEQGSSIVTFVWVGIAIATMAGVLLVGPGLELYGPFRMAGLGIPAAAAMLVPACLGWFAERRRLSPKWGFDWDVVRRQKPLFTCTLILTMAVVMTSLFAMLGLPLVWQTTFSILWSGGVGLASVYLLPPTLWKPMLFLFLQSAMTINTYGFMDNFFLDTATRQQSLLTGYPVCKDCPHLDSTFYVTVVGLWDALFVLLGSWLFNDVMANWTYRRAIFTSQVVMSAAMLLDAVQFERLNVRLGIPDPLFLILRHAVQNISAMAHFIPGTILMSKLCPAGVESTVYSLLAGYSNFGMTIGNYLGAFCLEHLGLGDVGKGDVDVFRNTGWAVAIHALSPLLAMSFLPLLVPNARMSDVLQHDEGSTPLLDTGGSGPDGSPETLSETAPDVSGQAA